MPAHLGLELFVAALLSEGYFALNADCIACKQWAWGAGGYCHQRHNYPLSGVNHDAWYGSVINIISLARRVSCPRI